MLHRKLQSDPTPSYHINVIPTVVQGLNLPDGKCAVVCSPNQGNPFILKSGLPADIQKKSPQRRYEQLSSEFNVTRVDDFGMACPMVGFSLGDLQGIPLGNLSLHHNLDIEVGVVDLYRYDQNKNTVLLEVLIAIEGIPDKHVLWLEVPGPLSMCLHRVTKYITFLHSMSAPSDNVDYEKTIFTYLFGSNGSTWKGDVDSQANARWRSLHSWLQQTSTRLGPSTLSTYVAALCWFSECRHVSGNGSRSKYVNVAEYNKRREFKIFHDEVLSRPFSNTRLDFS